MYAGSAWAVDNSSQNFAGGKLEGMIADSSEMTCNTKATMNHIDAVLSCLQKTLKLIGFSTWLIKL